MIIPVHQIQLKFFIYLIISLLFFSCQETEEDKLLVIKNADESGIDFRNQLSATSELNILTYLYYYNGAGVAVADFDNDGWEDVYFVSNQGQNKLYLNQGNLKFKESTPEILKQNEGWSTGVSIVDINADGLKDIYLCKVGDYNGIKGRNMLFVNKGADANGKIVFEEEAENYNLDIISFATQSSFFDYDLDGDLDMYLVNHSVHPNRTYGRGSKRTVEDSLSGDRLYRNDNGLFTDVSQQTGIFQGAIGYGLGVLTTDINNDGFPDIYVANDFFENDYLYINNQDGTFNEIISSDQNTVGHTSHYSMGVDIEDLNNDGLNDIFSLDMLPENLSTFKSSGTEYGFTIYNQYLKNGYKPQYMQNALQLNRGASGFSEIAFLSGVAASEWSWAPLIQDFDNDGYKDIFISNGIKGATNDMDFISFIANDNIQKRINKGMTKEDLALIDEIPEKKVSNYFYKNNGDLSFSDVSGIWAENIPSFSNGAVYADLDKDGDLDIVVNNVNEQAFIYENRSTEKYPERNFLQIKLKNNTNNIAAIGARVQVYFGDQILYNSLTSSRGYLSSVSDVLTMGLGKQKQVDSLIISWPEGEKEVFRDIKINSANTLVRGNGFYIKPNQETKIQNKTESATLNYRHKDYETKDFSYEPLAPFAISNEGPHVSCIDINDDGFEDIFIPGGRFESSKLYLQNKEGIFTEQIFSDFDLHKKYEDIDQTIFDVDGDGDKDIIMVSGGNESIPGYNSPPRLYVNESGNFKFKQQAFNIDEINASTVTQGDIDNDGDIDLFIGANSIPGSYGKVPDSYLMLNDSHGNFSTSANFDTKIGLVYDAKFMDFDKDNDLDLIVVGHYMPVSIYLNDGKGNFKKHLTKSLSNSKGWWNAFDIADYDNDGDLDIVAGNWGLNTRLRASVEQPLTLYRSDFDGNGKVDPIVTYFYQNRETPIATKSELTKQIPVLNKNFLSYKDFAQANFEDYFSKEKIKSAEKQQVYMLSSTYFENKGDFNFEANPLPWTAQISSIQAIQSMDINDDGYLDVIIGGNTYEMSTQLGRLDGSYGEVLINKNGKGFVVESKKSYNIKGAVRSIGNITINEDQYLIFGINNDSIRIVKTIK